MPKSRKRRTGRHHHRAPQGSNPLWVPRLTPRERQLWRASEEAELRGDARTALRLYRQIDAVGESEHRDMLDQLVEYEAVLPEWARARWLVAQAMRLDSPSAEVRHHKALDAAIVTAYAEDPDGRRLPSDPAQVLARLMARNWVYRQMSCYQLGGLAETLSLASAELLTRCGPVDQWVEAELGGYRLEAVGDGVATLRDLVSGTPVDILDIGTCGELEVGDHAIGRLVPIGESPGLMAESRLIPVPETAAVEIAWSPEGWLDTVAWLATDRGVPRFSEWDPGPLCSDVPELVWRLILLPEGVSADSPELSEAHRRITAGRHTRHQDAVLLLRGVLASWPTIPPGERSACGYYAAAALLSSGVLAAIHRSSLVATIHEPWWRELAASVAEPARSICLALANRSGTGRAAS